MTSSQAENNSQKTPYQESGQNILPFNDNIAIKVENLTKIYKLYDKPVDRLKESLHPFKKKYHREFYALKNLNFEVKEGETVGIIGKNGAGKSTLLQIITGVVTPTSGNVIANGKIAALLELGTGFNPELTGIENIYFSGTIMGYTKEEIDAKLDDIISFADIGDFINQPIKLYSSGMMLRLAFSVAINVDPKILIIDEALAVVDMKFQQKCLRKLKVFKNNNCSILFVSHDPGSIINFCDRAIWLNAGEVYQIGKPNDIVGKYVTYMSYDAITTDKQISKKIISKNLVEETNNIQFSIDKLTVTEQFIEIEGWAYIEEISSKDSNIYIILNSEKDIFTFLPKSSKRPDVTEINKLLNLNLDNSGFSATIPLEQLKNDKYKLAIYIENKDIKAFLYTDKVVDLYSPPEGQKFFSDDNNIEWDDVSKCSSFGEGGAEIKKVALYSKNSYKKINIFPGGEQVIFFVDIEIKRDIYSPIVGLILNDKYGNTMLGINSYIYNVEINTLTKGERIVVEFEFEFPKLKNGYYFFTTSIADGTQLNHIQHHWVNEAYTVQVSNISIRNKIGAYFIVDNPVINIKYSNNTKFI